MTIEIDEELLRDLIYDAEEYHTELRKQGRHTLANEYKESLDKAKQLLTTTVEYDIPVFGGYISSIMLKKHESTQKI